MLEVKNLNKVFGNKTVLYDLNFEIGSKDIFAIIGPNGSGKTTLLNILTGAYSKTSGIINKKFKLDQIGYLKDISELDINLTGKEYLYCVERFFKIKDLGLKDYLIEAFDLKEDITKMVKEYSHGMTKKLLIISELMHNPQVLFLDEPFNGLDAEYRIFFENILKKLNEIGVTIIISSHDLDFVENFSQKILILIKGCVEFCGPKDELLKRFGNDIKDSWLSLIKKEKTLTLTDGNIFEFYRNSIS